MGSTNSHTSERDVAPAVSESSNSSPTVTVNPSSWTFASDAQITAASASSFQPPSSPASSPSADVTSASAAASTNSSKQSQTTSPHVATIVGSAVGGAAFVTVLLLACFLFFRRRRQRPEYLRRPSRQRLLGSGGSRGSINSTHGSHTRQYSQPSLPIPQSPFIPSAPVFSPNRRCSSSNQELAMDKVHLPGESEGPRGEDILADPEGSAASPSAQVSPPSRTASSTYSQSSWEDDIRLLDYYESVPQVSIYESTYYAGGSTLTLPSVGFPVPNYLDTPKTRFDARSDPFDLEAPPKALRKGPPIAPHPTPWGVNF
ncbi:uncharacterized protein N7459_002058 [Penicillium hispanicum]|uniref:uncharacterized protein n=1 Tax=Penicillium hispanicum TaxID=1080232 RepID=UPI002540D02D|nr:uncharacterized protein N7459_002058 [Penicillium hispanicum]KAJ5591689.1 hypothetical protein N7459_002058 [Penicillium hispanicum]